MDKTYILMCEKAIEIQELWEPKEGDYIRDNDNKDFGYNSYISTFPIVAVGFKTRFVKNPIEPFLLVSKELKHKFLWLPTQSDLQGMLSEDFQSVHAFSKCAYIINKCTEDREYFCEFDSMEQLWLAFVMKEKFNKTWDGTNWIFQNQ